MEGGYRLHRKGDRSGDGEEEEVFYPHHREERRRSRTDEEVLASQEIAQQLDYSVDQEETIRNAIAENEGWQLVDDVIESRFEEIDQNIVSSSRDLLAMLDVADAGSINFFHDLDPLKPFITREPHLLERVVKKAKAANATSDRTFVTIDDLARIIKQQGAEKIEYEQTKEDVEQLKDIGVDRVELERRLEVGTFREKFDVRMLARLLREGPMQKFVAVIRFQAEQIGEVDFDEVLVRAKGVIRRHNRQEAELAAGEERAVERWEAKLGEMGTRKKVLRELEGYINEIRMRRMLQQPPEEDTS